MTGVALAIAALLVLATGLIRAAGASLVRTPRADAVHDAADGDQRAAKVAELLLLIGFHAPSLGDAPEQRA